MVVPWIRAGQGIAVSMVVLSIVVYETWKCIYDADALSMIN